MITTDPVLVAQDDAAFARIISAVTRAGGYFAGVLWLVAMVPESCKLLAMALSLLTVARVYEVRENRARALAAKHLAARPPEEYIEVLKGIVTDEP